MSDATHETKAPPWTEEQFLKMVKLVYADLEIDDAELTAAIQWAYDHEGCAALLGNTGQQICFRPGLKAEMGLC
jgi:hypothetical protein